MTKRRKLGLVLSVVVALAVLGFVAAAVAVEWIGVTPRVLGPYIERRTAGHNPTIEVMGRAADRMLMTLDRGSPPSMLGPLSAVVLGAQDRPTGAGEKGDVVVATPDEMRAAIAAVVPGTVITLLPGTYRFEGGKINLDRPGQAEAPITVRAARPGSVKLEFAMVEGFRVSAPYWRFENLIIHGACGDDDSCEHAFHVVGGASHFVAINNTISDFNAHFKINGEDGRYPDTGLIESNTLGNTHPRATARPVTPIDLVAASGWVVRANRISDFIKADGDLVSYGAFAKGGGSGNLFERNMVWCEQHLHGRPGQRVGLSLGGGGTGKEVCRDRQCTTEQNGGTLRANLIVGCSDAGIYLNNASASRVEDNTLVDTGGIDVRFPASSAQLDGNLVDGAIRARNGGLLHLGDNVTTPLWQSFAGYHPVRALFVDPQGGDFNWRGKAPLRAQVRDRASAADLCAQPPASPPVFGAFGNFAACVKPTVPF